ncbi:MAG: NUDIX domain-containing protein [Myxococcales bacterium FL481]|nr:MAG: NUDIX domain-containing protein [Myxococcales bacterium FL481]
MTSSSDHSRRPGSPSPAVTQAMQAAALLRAWDATSPRQEHDLARALELVHAVDCCRRDHFVPGHFTASAFVLSPDRTHFLLIFHDKLERWLQPGGHVEPTDRGLESAARREVEEETGLVAHDLSIEHEGLFDLDVHRLPGRADEPAHEHFDLRFLFRARQTDVRAGDGVRAARWLSLAEVATLGDASVRRVGERLVARTGF